ncbi:hypothetical protein BYI23_B004560 [Burkholderia sp. YI23]|nr:hypothetical protein BYI23_B004560 [Burkholderia sp. YI23]
MIQKRDTRPRIERIRAALEKLGPSTVFAIANETGIDERAIGEIIRTARKKDFPGTRFRKAGKTREGCVNRSWLYEVSDEPDVIVAPARYQPSREKAVKHPGMTREEVADMKRRAELLRQMKPFRHWQDVALFGAAA